jgi:adenine-specific DNA-methyltransferase
MKTELSNMRWSDLWEVYCPDASSDELDRCEWLQASPLLPSEITLPVEVCEWLGRLYSIHANYRHRKTYGQFFTPSAVARYMASLSLPLEPHAVVVDPGAGVGILVAAIAECLVRRNNRAPWSVVVYESDLALTPVLRLALGYTRDWLKQYEVDFSYDVKVDDFILANVASLSPTPLLDHSGNHLSPHLIIPNPPYFKLPKSDPRVDILPDIVYGQPNIYALFMMAAAKLLRLAVCRREKPLGA